jgi:hypothetical protein
MTEPHRQGFATEAAGERSAASVTAATLIMTASE